jgi:hypothetical protein
VRNIRRILSSLLLMTLIPALHAEPYDANLASIIDSFLNARSSPIAGNGSVFFSSGVTYNVDPRLIVAISGAETTFGTNWGLCSPASFNAWSWFYNTSGANPCTNSTFSSYADGIQTVTSGIRRRYLNRNVNTIPNIGALYCGSGCGSWIPTVTSVYTTLGGDTSDLTFTNHCSTTLVSNFGPGDSYQNSTGTGWATGDGGNSSNAVAFVNTSGTVSTLKQFRFAANWFAGINTLNVDFWGDSDDLNTASLLESFTFSADAFRVPQVFTAVSTLHPALLPGNTYFITLSVPGAPATDWGWQWNNQGQNGSWWARFGSDPWFMETTAVTPAFDVCVAP